MTDGSQKKHPDPRGRDANMRKNQRLKMLKISSMSLMSEGLEGFAEAPTGLSMSSASAAWAAFLASGWS